MKEKIALKEQLARNLYWVGAAAKYGVGFPEWEILTPEQQGYLYKQADTLILTLLKQEIEKVENPFIEEAGGDSHEYAFEQCRQAILKILT